MIDSGIVADGERSVARIALQQLRSVIARYTQVRRRRRSIVRRQSMSLSVTENTLETSRHTTFYLACGPEDGPLMIFVHGWPELSLSWRHQLPCFGALGFRAIAPDMRGYGRSTVYDRHEH